MFFSTIIHRINYGIEINLPEIVRKVEDVNACIKALKENAQYLDQDDITQRYNAWSPEDKEKFIWKNGIKPDFSIETSNLSPSCVRK